MKASILFHLIKRKKKYLLLQRSTPPNLGSPSACLCCIHIFWPGVNKRLGKKKNGQKSVAAFQLLQPSKDLGLHLLCASASPGNDYYDYVSCSLNLRWLIVFLSKAWTISYASQLNRSINSKAEEWVWGWGRQSIWGLGTDVMVEMRRTIQLQTDEIRHTTERPRKDSIGSWPGTGGDLISCIQDPIHLCLWHKK